MKIISIVGARPNFIKVSPFVKAINEYNKSKINLIDHRLVHTGQHYDSRMSDNFFDGLNIPKPEINLNIGSGSHAEQVGNTMIAFEKVLKKEKPNWVVVFGDVNATLACSVTAKSIIRPCAADWFRDHRGRIHATSDFHLLLKILGFLVMRHISI